MSEASLLHVAAQVLLLGCKSMNNKKNIGMIIKPKYKECNKNISKINHKNIHKYQP